MSSKEEQKRAKLREKAAAAEREIQQILQKSMDDLKKTRDRKARQLAGLPPTHSETEEEKEEEERKKRKSRTLFGKIKSVLSKKSKSPSPPPDYDPPAYTPPAYTTPAYTPRSRGGTKRGKKTRRIKRRRRTLLKGRK